VQANDQTGNLRIGAFPICNRNLPDSLQVVRIGIAMKLKHLCDVLSLAFSLTLALLTAPASAADKPV